MRMLTIWTVLIIISGFPMMAQTITIGTWNIHKPDGTPPADRLIRIAEFCKDIDLLALQEVDETGTEVEQIALYMGPEYQCVVSEISVHERFGFIWRDPVRTTGRPEFVPDLDLGRRAFMGRFVAGSFDFQLMSVHLFWEGSKKTYPHTRGVEIKLLDEWLMHRKDRELDLIMVGDFNEPHMYYGYVSAPPHSSHYDFYDMLSRHQLLSVSMELRKPTSIVNINIYDHIIFNPAPFFTTEFSGIEQARVIAWETAFDMNKDGRLDYTEYEKAKASVTDHRLVTAVFRTDMPDDDEVEAVLDHGIEMKQGRPE